MTDIIKEIAGKYGIESAFKPFGNGHINDTYISADRAYVLQRINTNVFPDVEALMSNLVAVTEFLKDKIERSGGNPERGTINFVKNADGKYYYKASNGQTYRVYKFIDKVKSYDIVESEEILYRAAKAFGHFQMLLSDFPAETLNYIIPRFHDTPNRYSQLDDAILRDPLGRAKEVSEEIEFLMERREEAGKVVAATERGEVPVRVTHNDTKLNNVLLDDVTGEGVCVIDLDTVMPGSLLYDFGDALRFGASSASEDEKDLSKVWFNLEYFEAFTKGYLEETKNVVAPLEAELLAFSAKLMTLECGMRFLTDYINGDVYFKIHRENHNLDRARNQLKLVRDMELKMDEMNKIVAKYL